MSSAFALTCRAIAPTCTPSSVRGCARMYCMIFCASGEQLLYWFIDGADGADGAAAVEL